MQKTERQIRDDVGTSGEDQLVDTLQPLLSAGWRIMGRNVKVENKAGGKFGDIDVLLISPNKLGFSMDAKNGTQRVWYDPKTEEVVFDRGWRPTGRPEPKQRRYPIINAEYLAGWAERNFCLQKVIPIMACSDNLNLRLQMNVRNFYLLPFGEVVNKLRAIDANFSKAGPNESRYLLQDTTAIHLITERSNEERSLPPTDG